MASSWESTWYVLIRAKEATFDNDSVLTRTCTGNSLVRLAYDNETQASFTNQSTEETICPVVDAVTGLTTQLQGLLTSLSLIAIGGTATSAQTAAVQKLLGKFARSIRT